MINHLVLVCSILNEKLDNLLLIFFFFWGGGGGGGGGRGIVTSLAYICTMEQKTVARGRCMESSYCVLFSSLCNFAFCFRI